MGGRAGVRGLDKVIRNFRQLAPEMVKSVDRSLDTAGAMLEQAVRLSANLTDHSLKDLADLGHPYSTKKAEDSGPHPDQYVHIQKGRLAKSIKRFVQRVSNKPIVIVGADPNIAPEVKYLIDGTSKMRPRDFLGHAFLSVKESMLKIIQYSISLRNGSRREYVGNRSSKAS